MVVNMDYNDIKNIDISKIDKNKCFLILIVYLN